MRSPQRLDSLNHVYEDFVLGDYYVSPSRMVQQSDIDTYSELSGDKHPLHTDVAVAKAGIFGRITAQGCLTLSIATGLEYAMIGEDISGILVFTGMDRVRFVKPVFVEDTIRIEGRVSHLEERGDDKGLVVFHQEVKNQDDVIVVVYDKRMYHRRRAAAGVG